NGIPHSAIPDSPRAMWPASAICSVRACKTQSISHSGRKRRCSARPASTRWCSAPAASLPPTRPTSSSRSVSWKRRAMPLSACSMDPADTILRFLEGLGRRSEAEFYLGLFRAASKESFATLVVESAVLRQALEAVVLDLRFLAGLGLTPVVVLGLYAPGAGALEHAERLRRRLARVEVEAVVMPAELPEGDGRAVAQLGQQVTDSARA